MMKKCIALIIAIILFLVAFPKVVGDDKELWHPEVEFTIDGPTSVKAGEVCTYTFYLTPNPEADTYTLEVYWGDGMILYEYPDHHGQHPGPFYTGENVEITYRHESGLSRDRTIKAWAICGESRYETTLDIYVENDIVSLIEFQLIKKENTDCGCNNYNEWEFPIICLFLNKLFELVLMFSPYPVPLMCHIIIMIAEKFDCPDFP
jgi:hypothetical protein